MSGNEKTILEILIKAKNSLKIKQINSLAKQQSHNFNSKSVVSSLIKKGYVLNNNGVYSLTKKGKRFGATEKKKKITDYAMMIKDPAKENNSSAGEKDQRDNGRFIELRRTAGLETATPAKQNGEKNRNYIVLLNKHNSDIVEKLIKKDDLYINFTKMVYDTLKNENGGKFPRNDYKSVLALIKIIDIENSTNVWRFNREAVRKMASYISNQKNRFWVRLTEEEEKRKELVNDLVDASYVDGASEARSLASKVCKYIAEHEFKNNNLYYINDSFVRHVLPFYMKYYNSEDPVCIVNDIDYATLYTHLKKLHDKVNETYRGEKPISKSRFDHIMWYCYKNSGNTKK